MVIFIRVIFDYIRYFTYICQLMKNKLLIFLQDVFIDPRKARSRENYDLKEAKEDFRLWDKLYGRDVIKHLEQVSKWEPGKKEREKKERLAALEMKQV